MEFANNCDHDMRSDHDIVVCGQSSLKGAMGVGALLHSLLRSQPKVAQAKTDGTCQNRHAESQSFLHPILFFLGKKTKTSQDFHPQKY